MYLSMKAQTTSSGSLSIFGASFTHSKQWAWGDPLILNSIFITQSVIWPSGCASLSRYSEKNALILCWNIWTPVMGFWHKYLLLSVFVIISSQTVQLLLESFQVSVNQQQTMLGTMWGYLRFGALLIHHTTDPANKLVILLHFSEIYKPAYFWQALLVLLDFIGVQLWSCSLQVFFLEITLWPK